VSVPPADWLTAEEVAEYLDTVVDEKIELSTAAVKAAVERRRSDLDFTAPVPADVHAGSIMWAGLVFQSRNSPSGFAGYGDESVIYDTLGARRAEIMRLIGWRRPVVA
jgi:hypothetical protein